MIKNILFFSFLTSTALVAADTHSFQLTPTFGKNFSDNTSKMTNSEVMYGIRGAWQSKHGYGAELGFESGSDIKYVDMEKTTSLSRLFAHILLHGETSHDIEPYFLVGAGYEFLETNIEGDPDQSFLSAGLGFDYKLSTYVNLSLEGRAIYKLDTEDVDYVGTFGVSILFDDSFHLNSVGSPFEQSKVRLNAY